MGLYWLAEGELTPYELLPDEFPSGHPDDGGDPALSRLQAAYATAATEQTKRQAVVAEDIMTRAVQTASPQEPLGRALERMKQGRFRHLPVVREQRLVGILSDRDLLMLGHDQRSGATVAEAMTTQLITASPGTTIRRLARAVVGYRISCLPVLDEDGFLVGIVTTVDILRSIARSAPIDLWV